MVTNLATVAVLPVSENVPVQSFTMELQHALNAIGNVASSSFNNRSGFFVCLVFIFLSLESDWETDPYCGYLNHCH